MATLSPFLAVRYCPRRHLLPHFDELATVFVLDVLVTRRGRSRAKLRCSICKHEWFSSAQRFVGWLR